MAIRLERFALRSSTALRVPTDRVRGSHRVFRHPDHPTRVVVSLHGGDLRKGTLNAIINGSGLTREELLRRLR